MANSKTYKSQRAGRGFSTVPTGALQFDLSRARNSLSEGERRLASKRDSTGSRLSPAMLESVQRAVSFSRTQIAAIEKELKRRG